MSNQIQAAYSVFTPAQAAEFVKHWAVVAQTEKATGFSGTVFECIADDPLTGAKTGEKVMSFRSTEFIDDYARDNIATNSLEIFETGFAWGQLRDMEAWYEDLKNAGRLVPGQFSVTGYSLGGHLATAFNLMHPNEAAQVVTFNGAGVGIVGPSTTLLDLIKKFSDLATPNADGSSKFSVTNLPMAANAGRFAYAA